jgi:hypothetical protein
MAAEFKGATSGNEIDATKARAHLPGLDIEIVHRRSPQGDAEQISINLQAVPYFEAFGRFLETANPFAFWAQAARLAWFPWLAAADSPWRPFALCNRGPNLLALFAGGRKGGLALRCSACATGSCRPSDSTRFGRIEGGKPARYSHKNGTWV